MILHRCVLVVLPLVSLSAFSHATPTSQENTTTGFPVDKTLHFSIVAGILIATAITMALCAFLCFSESCCSRNDALHYGPSPFYYYDCCDHRCAVMRGER